MMGGYSFDYFLTPFKEAIRCIDSLYSDKQNTRPVFYHDQKQIIKELEQDLLQDIYFSKMDQSKGIWQIPIIKNNIAKTLFVVVVTNLTLAKPVDHFTLVTIIV